MKKKLKSRVINLLRLAVLGWVAIMASIVMYQCGDSAEISLSTMLWIVKAGLAVNIAGVAVALLLMDLEVGS